MSEIDEYLKDEYKRSTSFSLTPMYKQCLRKLGVKFYGSDNNLIATTLRRVIVIEGLNILNGEPIDFKLWEESEKAGDRESMMLKINDKIEELLQRVTTVHFMSRSHFVRYAVLRIFYKYFPEESVGKAKVVSLGRLF